MSKKRQAGFSLLELMVAMMIIAVLATLGFKGYTRYSATANRLKAGDTLKTVAEGLDVYYLRHGSYPDINGFEAMVDPGSVLVKENLIPVNTPSKDPWGQAYEARSSKATYFFKCLGDPANPDDATLGWFTREPGKLGGASGPADNGAPKAAPAGASK